MIGGRGSYNKSVFGKRYKKGSSRRRLRRIQLRESK